MTIDPTREEWQAALDALADSMKVVHPGCLVPHVEAILGPCPPEPVPADWRLEAGDTSRPPLRITRHDDDRGGILVGFPYVRYASLTPDEADAMAAALVEHAAYAREQEATTPSGGDPIKAREWTVSAPIAGGLDLCGRLLVGRGTDTWDPVCQRPKGHPAFCQSSPDGLDE